MVEAKVKAGILEEVSWSFFIEKAGAPGKLRMAGRKSTFAWPSDKFE